MSFVQVKDALKTIQEQYRSSVASLEQLSVDQQETELVRQLTQAQLRMHQTVSGLAKNADEATLNGWLQFFPDKQHDGFAATSPKPVPSVDALLQFYSELNRELVHLFELVSRSTECEATREIFDLLATVERQNARDLAWAGRRPV